MNSHSIIKAKKYYQQYKEKALKVALEENQELAVIKYLGELNKCFWSHKPDYDDEDYNDGNWDVVTLAAQYGRVDVLQWLTTYDLKLEGSPLLTAVIYFQYAALEWFIRDKPDQPGLNWESLIDLLAEDHWFIKKSHLIVYFEHYIQELLHASNLQKFLQRCQHEATGFCFWSDLPEQNNFKKQYLKLLKKSLELTLNERAIYADLLKEYERIDKKSAFEFHVNLLMKADLFSELKNYCFDMMKSKEAECAELGRIKLAELLLANYIEFDEENSPLNFFTVHENHFKRALQAFYLLSNCESICAIQLKQKLNDILSGNVAPFFGHSSVQTWNPKAVRFYPLYVFYKQNNLNTRPIIERNLNDYAHEENQKIERVKSKDKRKYKQESLLNFFKSNKKMQLDRIDMTAENTPSP